MEKKCAKCLKWKPLSEFHTKGVWKGKLRREGRCRDCRKIDRQGIYRKEYFKKYRLENPTIVKARDAFRRAVRKGEILRQPCEVCGKPNAEGHHEDYAKPFVVKWFCRVHHALLERKVKHALEPAYREGVYRLPPSKKKKGELKKENEEFA